MSHAQPLVQYRPYQAAARALNHLGLLAEIWRRQAGKSYYLGGTALEWMMERPCDVIFVSAALRLGQENIRKEAQIWRDGIAEARQRARELGAKLLIKTPADDDRGNLLDVDAVADLFEHQKLETKLYHDNTRYSRSIVVAPNPDTAVGWTANLILDEVGRMPEFQDLWEAVEPIVSSNPGLRVRLATTPPPDDAHYSYELLAPAAGSEFETNPRGNLYHSQAGLQVHRVDAWDGYAAGVPIYDLQTREALTPEESRGRALDKQAWDRNYGCQFIAGGSAALSLMQILNAQEAGAERGLVAHNITDQLAA